MAERLPSAKDRTYWAKWADAIFKQMKDVGEVEAWRARICLARGRCWLVGARVEELEDALEREQSAAAGSSSGGGDDSSRVAGAGTDGMTGSVLESKEAQEARQALETAISFFERVKGPASTSNDVDMEMDDVRPLVRFAFHIGSVRRNPQVCLFICWTSDCSLIVARRSPAQSSEYYYRRKQARGTLCSRRG